jgi:hypothetical protein
MEWIKRMLAGRELKELRQRVTQLEAKLVESQKNIDKTNAYWKKKFFDLKESKSKGS